MMMIFFSHPFKFLPSFNPPIEPMVIFITKLSKSNNPSTTSPLPPPIRILFEPYISDSMQLTP